VTGALDPRQREAVEVRVNAVVTAGAGSGKTSVLAERFLWLLRHGGVEVDGILALTFTRKAAAEMYERIYRRLQEGGEALRPALLGFDRAQVSTFDSFCAEILRNACELFGLSQDFRSDEQALARLAEREALAWLLEHLEAATLAQLLELHGCDAMW